MILWRPVYRLSEISLLVRVAFVGIHTSQIKCLTWSMTFFFWYMWSKWRDGWNEYITISFGCYIVFTLFKMIYQQTKGPPILNQKRLRFYRFSEVDQNSLQCFCVYEDQVLNICFDFIYQENIFTRNVYSISHISCSMKLYFLSLNTAKLLKSPDVIEATGATFTES